MKKSVLLIAILFLIPTISYKISEQTVENNETYTVELNNIQAVTETLDDKDYWALLIAVGVYANNPDMDRPSMFVEVDNLHNTLLVSERWQEDHIRVITGENATVLNMLKGFQWLDEMEDEDDVCLVYLTTHGFPILWDLPPFDEEDGMDEALAAYRGFLPLPNPWSWEPLANPFGIITDDMINNNLNKLECSGLSIIVDSCHSGGFNDNWTALRTNRQVNIAWELAQELQGRNRVIVTSVPEEDTSYGSYFSHYLAEGMQGYGDANDDGVVSIEEAFWYAEPIIRNETRMLPQIFDDYPGELLLTEVELPPSVSFIEGEEIGKTNTTCTYQLYAEDPEGDAIQYYINWGDGNDEYTDFYASGEFVNITYEWQKERTYEIMLKAIDEHGAGGYWNYVTVTMADKHEVDQRQVEHHRGFSVNKTQWVAQSFVPFLGRISKVELNLFVWEEGYNVYIAIRESLSGSDLATVSKIIEPPQDWESQWVSFNFNEISLIPGNEYYIVCSSSAEEGGIRWSTSGHNNPYQNGTLYYSEDGGNEWECHQDRDATFVTYG